MASLVVRRLDETVKQRLRERAESRGLSLEAEVRRILEEAAGASAIGNGDASDLAEKGFGDLMYERFGKRGLTPRECRRLARAREELREAAMLRVPDFDE